MKRDTGAPSASLREQPNTCSAARLEHHDALGFVDGDDRVHGGVEDGGISRLGVGKYRLYAGRFLALFGRPEREGRLGRQSALPGEGEGDCEYGGIGQQRGDGHARISPAEGQRRDVQGDQRHGSHGAQHQFRGSRAAAFLGRRNTGDQHRLTQINIGLRSAGKVTSADRVADEHA
ncbi:MAG: hypothetical protein IPK29_17625 [Betaproteobacteria bacterium]|nr:hypothetical protein [Betaproteobacteria bacterium]